MILALDFRSERRRLRQLRRDLDPRTQRRHAAAVCRHLSRHPAWLRARSIAGYWPNDGELDPRPLLHLALARGQRCFLPILATDPAGQLTGTLRFAPYRPGQPLRPNRFGIPEPRAGRGEHPRDWTRTLDLILLPLVGFDANGSRLGMGGGFYDRTLAFVQADRRSGWRRPTLIGLAHECQRLTHIEPAPWDIRLDAILTERRLYPARRSD